MLTPPLAMTHRRTVSTVGRHHGRGLGYHPGTAQGVVHGRGAPYHAAGHVGHLPGHHGGLHEDPGEDSGGESMVLWWAD